MRRIFLAVVLVACCASPLAAQPASRVNQPPPPKAVYTPRPIYRAEWAKQGLAGKGVVLVSIDRETGKVTGTRMSTSTGNKQLDGAALEAYSRWRFQPGTGSQVKIPIEFATRARPQPPKSTLPQPVILLVVLAVGVAAMMIFKKRRSA